MKRRLAGVLLLPLLLAVPPSAAELRARVSAELEPAAPLRVGEAVNYQLHIESNALSFQGLRVVPPRVAGGLLLADAVSSTKGTRRFRGETWQYVSYRFPVFPRREGRLQLGPAEVSFTASPGFGRPGRDFALSTDAIERVVHSPPAGVDLVARDFAMSRSIEPDRATAMVGDALRVTVTRRLRGAPALLLDPLPLPAAPGCSVYPEAPELSDRSDRGELTGTRIDRFSLVFEAPGAFRLPARELGWLNPVDGSRGTARLPERLIRVSAVTAEGSAGSPPWLTVAATALVGCTALVVALGWRRYRRGAGLAPLNPP